MGWVHESRMTQTYVHLSGRDQDKAILRVYGIESKDEKPIKSDRQPGCLRCNEPNDRNTRFCWKCGMILNNELTEKINLIENSVLESNVVEDSTKKLIETFPPEFKDLILESVLK